MINLAGEKCLLHDNYSREIIRLSFILKWRGETRVFIRRKERLKLASAEDPVGLRESECGSHGERERTSRAPRLITGHSFSFLCGVQCVRVIFFSSPLIPLCGHFKDLQHNQKRCVSSDGVFRFHCSLFSLFALSQDLISALLFSASFNFPSLFPSTPIFFN